MLSFNDQSNLNSKYAEHDSAAILCKYLIVMDQTTYIIKSPLDLSLSFSRSSITHEFCISLLHFMSAASVADCLLVRYLRNHLKGFTSHLHKSTQVQQ